MHRRIYMAIRQHDSAAAREAMDRHLQLSFEAQSIEDGTRRSRSRHSRPR